METVLAHLAGVDVPQSVTPVLRATAGGAQRGTEAGLWRVFAWLPDRVVRTRPGRRETGAAGHALGAVLAALVTRCDALQPVHAAFHDLSARTANYRRALETARRSGSEPRRVDRSRGGAVAARIAVAPDAAARRVLHGDPKFSNFLLPDRSGDALALVDWDTVMVGPVAWDLGDFPAPRPAVETRTIRAARASMDVCSRGRRLLRGSWRELADEDIRARIAAPAHMSFMLGVRFLTDHLDGDRYFRVRRSGQNLVAPRPSSASPRPRQRATGAVRELALA